MNDLMKGKRGLVMGVANEKSIAWGMAKALHEQGAELAFTYQGDAFGKRVKPLAESVGSNLLIDCDVTAYFECRDMRHLWKKNNLSRSSDCLC